VRNFDSVGASRDADVGSVSAAYPVVRSRQYSLYAQLGYDYKSLRDRTSTPTTLTDKKSGLLALALSGDYFDELGAGVASAFSLGYGRGDSNIETPAAKSIDDAPATSGDDDHTRGWLLAIKYF
jgi:hemolysin activation/secretion protein